MLVDGNFLSRLGVMVEVRLAVADPLHVPPYPPTCGVCAVRVFFADARVSDETWARVTIDRGCWVSKGVELPARVPVDEPVRLAGLGRRLWGELTGDTSTVLAVTRECGRTECITPRHYTSVGVVE